MVNKNYIPERGDLVWINLNPQAGHEQAGHRPALVVSPREYNYVTGLCVLFPVTSQIKGYPFEVKVNFREINGVILSDHIKNLDWKIRQAQFISKVPPNVLEEAIGLFRSLIESDS